MTKKELREQLKGLLKFCKENHCLMYNSMQIIKQIRKEPEDKILREKLKKQAKDYQQKNGGLRALKVRKR